MIGTVVICLRCFEKEISGGSRKICIAASVIDPCMLYCSTNSTGSNTPLYRKSPYSLYTSASLVLSTVILAVIALLDRNPDIDIASQIDKIVDATFQRYEKGGVFSNSNLTYNDVNTMVKIFKEDKLYYELLR